MRDYTGKSNHIQNGIYVEHFNYRMSKYIFLNYIVHVYSARCRVDYLITGQLVKIQLDNVTTVL